MESDGATTEFVHARIARGRATQRGLQCKKIKRVDVPREGTELTTEQRDFRARQEELGSMADMGENEEREDEKETRVEKEAEITRSVAGDRDIT